MGYDWLLIFVGFAVGAYGTLIGAGGGFVLMPLLILLFPHRGPKYLTAVSLSVVFFNAGSGSLAYARMKRIHFKAGVLFAAAGLPGAVIGALATSLLSADLFNAILGFLLIGAGIFLTLTPPSARSRMRAMTLTGRNGLHPAVAAAATAAAAKTDAPFPCNCKLGMLISFFVGLVSGLLGIGGGILHVPALVFILRFPVHYATATSHFILTLLALAGSVTHLVHLDGQMLRRVLVQVLFLSIGVIPGAQVGAMLSTRMRGRWILRGLAIALGFVGVRILLRAFHVM